MTGWRDKVGPVVAAAIGTFLAVLAFLEATTLVVALLWLDRARLPMWLLLLWAVRTPLYAIAAEGLFRRRVVRGWGLAVAMLGLILVLGLGEAGHMEHEQMQRRQTAFYALVLLVAVGPGWFRAQSAKVR